MKVSFLGYDYLAGFPEVPRSVPVNAPLLNDFHEIDRRSMYIRPDRIIKSSVGEFYDKNMDFFLETIALLEPVVIEKVIASGGTLATADIALAHLLPLGYTTQAPGGHFEEFMYHIENPTVKSLLNEGSVHMLDEVQQLVSFYINPTRTRTLDTMATLERVAHGLCAGYTPQAMDQVARVPNDSGYMSEYIMANILYPWVMQPMRQLRLLMPAIDKTFADAIAVRDSVAANLDIGYSISYDFLGDFFAYGGFRNVRPQHPCRFLRQYWTPFFGFSMPALLTEVEDPKLKDRILECVARSKKLYVEMLKTGLRYQAQYAILCGFIGRFNLSGNLGAILDYVYALRQEDQPSEVKDMVAEIEKNLKATIPFVNQAKLLDGI